MTITMYGIKNCTTVKKARAWLEDNKTEYGFHDYKTAGIAPQRLDAWCSSVGWETLFNRQGMTFRNLPEKDKRAIDERKAKSLMLARPTLIKRPVLELPKGKLLVGFGPQGYQDLPRRK